MRESNAPASRGRPRKYPHVETRNLAARVPAPAYDEFSLLCKLLPGKPSVSGMVAQLIEDYCNANRHKLSAEQRAPSAG